MQSDNFSLQILHFNDIHSSEKFNIEITAADNNTAAASAEKLNMKDKEIYTNYIIKNSPLHTMIDPVIIYK